MLAKKTNKVYSKFTIKISIMFKNIIIPFSGNETEISSIKAGLYLAKQYDIKVTILHISPDPDKILVTEYYSMGITTMLRKDIMKDIKKISIEQKQKAYDITTKYATDISMKLNTDSMANDKPGIYFDTEIGDANKIIIKKGRISDLIILGKEIQNNSLYTNIITSTLFESGCPLIITPSIKLDMIGKTIVIAWDGSSESSRALKSAMPIYSYAKKIYILQIQEKKQISDMATAENVVNYLKSHNIKAEAIIEKNKKNIGQVIINKTQALDADLLIMGAYTHNRIQQKFMGGATSFMLEKANIPIFMVH